MSQVPTGGKYLKAKELKPGDKVKILDEANWEKSEYNGKEISQYTCNVEYNGEQRKLKLTMASCNEIAPVYGKDSTEWIGKELSVESIKVMVGGEIKKSILATPVGIAPSESHEDAVWDE